MYIAIVLLRSIYYAAIVVVWQVSFGIHQSVEVRQNKNPKFPGPGNFDLTPTTQGVLTYLTL